MFAEKVTDNTYIGYIKVLENKNKVRTFLSLARTQSEKKFQMWLEKEVSKTVSIDFFFYVWT
jgi:hypothetical protein